MVGRNPLLPVEGLVVDVAGFRGKFSIGGQMTWIEVQWERVVQIGFYAEDPAGKGPEFTTEVIPVAMFALIAWPSAKPVEQAAPGVVRPGWLKLV